MFCHSLHSTNHTPLCPKLLVLVMIMHHPPWWALCAHKSQPEAVNCYKATQSCRLSFYHPLCLACSLLLSSRCCFRAAAGCAMGPTRQRRQRCSTALALQRPHNKRQLGANNGIIVAIVDCGPRLPLLFM